MYLGELLNTLTDEMHVTIHDINGAELIDHAPADEVPEFMHEYSIHSIAPRNHNTLSIVTNEESITQPLDLIHTNACELYDLGDCRSFQQAVDTTVERLRDLASTAERLADNLENGRPWRAGLFPTCSR